MTNFKSGFEVLTAVVMKNVIRSVSTDVSKGHIASTFRVEKKR
jgi:hypothetical protein